MTAAMIVGSAAHTAPDLPEIRRELSRLHILLLTVKADVDEVLSPGSPAGTAIELKKGIKQAFTCLNALRERVDEA
jgi:hypothetical protein